MSFKKVYRIWSLMNFAQLLNTLEFIKKKISRIQVYPIHNFMESIKVYYIKYLQKSDEFILKDFKKS